jgi:hypothetical protein
MRHSDVLSSPRERRLYAFISAVVVIAALLHASAFAQQIQLPPPGSDLRKVLLDALQPVVQAEVGGPIEFVVQEIRVQGNWAFTTVKPQRPGGTSIDWTRTKFRDAITSDMMSELVLALLHADGPRWRVVELSIGPTDVVWEGWASKHRLERQLFLQ